MARKRLNASPLLLPPLLLSLASCGSPAFTGTRIVPELNAQTNTANGTPSKASRIPRPVPKLLPDGTLPPIGKPAGDGIDTNDDEQPDVPGFDTNGDDHPDTAGVDTDGDGVPDAPFFTLCEGVQTNGYDTNFDGIPDVPGFDTNHDGKVDCDDVNGVDTNRDGVIDQHGFDLNGDGVADGIDTDFDGHADAAGFDTNGDGIPDCFGVDTNGDGVVDAPGFYPVVGHPDRYVWADTNGDGIPDAPGFDMNGDGIPDTGGVDTNGDGIPDAPGFVRPDGSLDPGIDTNGDGIPDQPSASLGAWNAVGVGNAVTFTTPAGLAIDPTGSGTLYVSDELELYRVNLADLSISSLPLHNPQSIVWDGHNSRLVVADDDGIQAVSASGEVTTLLSPTDNLPTDWNGDGTPDRLTTTVFFLPDGSKGDEGTGRPYPGGVAVAADGTLYFSQTGLQAIYKMPNGAAPVTLLAGNPTVPGSLTDGANGTTSLFKQPARLTCSGSTLYVVDGGWGAESGFDRKLRSVSTANGAVTTFTTLPVTDPEGLTTDPTTLWLADSAANLVRGYPIAQLSNPSPSHTDFTTGTVIAGLGGGAAPSSLTPQDVVRFGGNLYVLDQAAHALFRIALP